MYRRSGVKVKTTSVQSPLKLEDTSVSYTSVDNTNNTATRNCTFWKSFFKRRKTITIIGQTETEGMGCM